ncbi:MAG: hypothetical protein ISP90_14660 [Nevskia sp.]|nr:hypothetical protein [Nevskia sp.]
MIATDRSRLHRYCQRLRASAKTTGWRTVVNQLVASLWWRIDPRQAPMRAVMRENDSFDARFGTDTRGEMSLENAGIAAAEAALGNGVYRAIPASHFRAALQHLDIRFEDFTFLDYGSGKGKALLLAADYPFKRIVGVEYSPLLHETALSNIRRCQNQSKRCNELQAVLADARTYDPPGDPLVCFFFNPFDSSVWRSVLGRLQASFAMNPRPIHLVYVNVRDVAELEDIFPDFPIFIPVVRTKTCRILSAGAGTH